MKTSGFFGRVRHSIAVAAFAHLSACAQRPDIGASAGDLPAGSASVGAPAPPPSSRRAPGENPFGLPVVQTSARAGDFALVPSRGSLNQAFEQAPGSQSLLYAGAHVDKPGERDSSSSAVIERFSNVSVELRGIEPLTS